MPVPSFEPSGDFRALSSDLLEDLDVLTRLVEHPERWWDAEMIHRELGIGVEQARATLVRLARRNLLDIRVTHTVRYQFRPATPNLEATVLSLVEAHRRRRDASIEVFGDERSDC
jgi:hypothetical protein